MSTFQALWLLDDFGHRRLPRSLHRLLLGRLCDWLDDELCKPFSKFHGSR